MRDYIRKIRSKIGQAHFICPGARVIIENEKGEYLFIIRSDNGQLGIPAGGLEEGETIEQCIVRETLEETGLRLLNIQMIGVSSDPQKELVEYPNGDVTQYFVIEFYSNQFEGALRADEVETKSVAFRSASFIDRLPPNERATFDSLEYYQIKGIPRLD